MKTWLVYLLRCRDGSLYCGATVDLKRRLAQHNSGAGAKYIVPSRRPAECVWKRRVRNVGDALRLEDWLKRKDTETRRALAEGKATLRRVRGKGWTVAWRRKN